MAQVSIFVLILWILILTISVIGMKTDLKSSGYITSELFKINVLTILIGLIISALTNYYALLLFSKLLNPNLGSVGSIIVFICTVIPLVPLVLARILCRSQLSMLHWNGHKYCVGLGIGCYLCVLVFPMLVVLLI